MMLNRSITMQVLDYIYTIIRTCTSLCIPASRKTNCAPSRYGLSLINVILFTLVSLHFCPHVYGFGTLENQAPEIRFSNYGEWSNSPYVQEIIQDNDLIFEDDNVSPLAINRFWIVDADSMPEELLVTLELRVHGSDTAIISSNNVGSISLSTVDGLRHPTDPSWTGQNEQSMTFYGEYMDSSYTLVLHNALDDLRFSPHPDFIGRVDLYIYVNDEGHNGAYVNNLPDKKSDSDTVVINVIPESIPLSTGTTEDTPLTISYDNLTDDAGFPNDTSGDPEYAGEPVILVVTSLESGRLFKDDIEVELDDSVVIQNGDELVWYPDADVSDPDIDAFSVKIIAQDGWISSPIPVLIDVTANNAPPVVVIDGNDEVTAIAGDEYQELDIATLSDTEDSSLTVTWTVVSQPDNSTVTFSTDSSHNATSEEPYVTFNTEGSYVLRVTTTDSGGNSDFDTVMFNVSPSTAPAAPTIVMLNPADGQYLGHTGETSHLIRALITDTGDVDPDSVTFEIYHSPDATPIRLSATYPEDAEDEYVADWRPGADGLYMLKVSASNKSGITTESYSVVNVDSNPLSGIDGATVQIISSTATEDEFGYAVDISGNFAIIGAPKNNITGTATNAGKVYFYKRDVDDENTDGDVTDWISDGSFDLGTNATNNDQFGFSVAISGNRAVVGAPYYDGTDTDSGAVFHFKRVDGDWTMDTTPLEDPYHGDDYNYEEHEYGFAVDLDKDTLVVGAPGWERLDTNPVQDKRGRAYVYKISDSDEYELVTSLGLFPRGSVGGSASNEDGAQFGYAVAVSGNAIAVGSPFREVSGVTDAGEVFVFEEEHDQWDMTLRLVMGYPSANAHFGSSVALEGRYLLVGEKNRTRSTIPSAGNAHLFERKEDTWLNLSNTDDRDAVNLTTPVAYQAYGTAVALQNQTLVIGEPKVTGVLNTPGNAYIFNLASSGASLSTTLSGTTSSHNDDRMGQSVAIYNGTILVGAPSVTTTEEGYVTFFTIDTPTAVMTSPRDQDSFAYGQDITVFALPFDPQGVANIGAVKLLVDGDEYETNLGEYSNTPAYYVILSTDLAPGKHTLAIRVTDDDSNTYDTDPITIDIYNVDNTPDEVLGSTPANTDNDTFTLPGEVETQIEDWKELLYYGNLDTIGSDSSSLDTDGDLISDYQELFDGTDPTVADGLPQIVSPMYPLQASTVPAPVSYDSVQDDNYGLRLTINTQGLNTSGSNHEIIITDRFGKEITDRAYISTNGIEIAIDPMDGNDPAAVDESQYLSGITHVYTVSLDNDTTDSIPATVYEIFFTVDASPPVVTASRPGGRVSEDSISVTLTSNDDVQPTNIVYELDGSGTWINYTGAIDINKSTVLAFKATDNAGNVGPVGQVYYQFGDELHPISGFLASYNQSTRYIDCTWDNWVPSAGYTTPIIGYHIYRAINPVDIKRLKDSLENDYPPPHYLRLTGSTDGVSHETTEYTDNDTTPGTTAWYGVTITTADGNESVISNLSEVTTALPPANEPTIDYDIVVKRATRWLIANQDESGCWDGDNTSRIVATSQALNALGRVNGVTENHPDIINRGLAYIAGHFEDNNDAIARSAETLQRYRWHTHAIHTKLEFRANKSGDDLQGWGIQRNYYPDPLHTALGAIARHTASYDTLGLEDITDFLADTTADTTIQSIVGTNRYGWIPRNSDSIYVSALVYKATNQHHPITSPVYSWITPEVDGSYGGNILDTAGVMLALPITDTARDAAKYYLRDQQQPNGSWEDDPFLTALCLEAMADRQALLLHGANGNNVSALGALMERRGYTVTEKTASTFNPSQVYDYQLILVTGDIDHATLGTQIRDVPIPVIVCSAYLYHDMAMAGPETTETGTDADAGIASSQDTISILATDHPLAAGISNLGEVFDSTYSITWAKPVNNRSYIATLESDNTVATIFIYETGDPMVGGLTAPARRLGCFVNSNADALTDEGKALLDAAIEWITTPVVRP